jgi:hypothetical protein
VQHWTQRPFNVTAFSKSNGNHVVAERLFRRHFQINNNKPLPFVYVNEPEDDSGERMYHL